MQTFALSNCIMLATFSVILSLQIPCHTSENGLSIIEISLESNLFLFNFMNAATLLKYL